MIVWNTHLHELGQPDNQIRDYVESESEPTPRFADGDMVRFFYPDSQTGEPRNRVGIVETIGENFLLLEIQFPTRHIKRFNFARIDWDSFQLVDDNPSGWNRISV